VRVRVPPSAPVKSMAYVGTSSRRGEAQKARRQIGGETPAKTGGNPPRNPRRQSAVSHRHLRRDRKPGIALPSPIAASGSPWRTALDRLFRGRGVAGGSPHGGRWAPERVRGVVRALQRRSSLRLTPRPPSRAVVGSHPAFEVRAKNFKIRAGQFSTSAIGGRIRFN
jgi:hypothetical protein